MDRDLALRILGRGEAIKTLLDASARFLADKTGGARLAPFTIAMGWGIEAVSALLLEPIWTEHRGLWPRELDEPRSGASHPAFQEEAWAFDEPPDADVTEHMGRDAAFQVHGVLEAVHWQLNMVLIEARKAGFATEPGLRSSLEQIQKTVFSGATRHFWARWPELAVPEDANGADPWPIRHDPVF